MTDEQKVQLLPCPFCGGGASMVVMADEDGDFAVVSCEKCGAASRQHYFCGDDARDFAAAAWNTRQAALSHASATAEECSVVGDDARDAKRWREFLSMVDPDLRGGYTVYRNIDVRTDQMIYDGRDMAENIDQAIAAKRGGT